MGKITTAQFWASQGDPGKNRADPREGDTVRFVKSNAPGNNPTATRATWGKFWALLEMFGVKAPGNSQGNPDQS